MQFVARHYQSRLPIRVEIRDAAIAVIAPEQVTGAALDALPWVAPGVLDIQVNGYGGLWFSSDSLRADDVSDIVFRLSERGVARCLPTLITNSHDALRHGLTTLDAACRRDPLLAAQVAGIHLEGPWISPDDGPRGAHPVAHVRAADPRELDALFAASGERLRLLTVAPEIPGCLPLIRRAVDLGIAVSIGHTAAGREDLAAAVDAGARFSTHLGNGCAAEMARHDNPLWPQLADDRLRAGVITDGHHLPDDVLRCVLRCKSWERVMVTCDVSGFAGCPVGRHQQEGLDVEVLADGRIVVAGQRRFLAGSAATTLDCLAQVGRVTGCAIADAWQLVSQNPATALHLPVPRLEPGAPATLNVFHCERSADGSLVADPVATLVNGVRTGASGPWQEWPNA